MTDRSLLFEATTGSRLLKAIQLPKRYHPQTEGIAFGADGSLILADEGGNNRGRVGVYAGKR